jgi:hypothetical protein
MNRRAILAAVAAIGIAASSLAGEPEQKKPEAPKPPAEVERLGYFLGPWSSEGEVKPGPMGAGGPTTGRDMCGWMPGGFFLGCVMQSKGPMGMMQIQAVMGYDAEKKVYRWWSFDNLGQAETATGTLKDDVWTWSGESKIGGKVVKTRYTISDTQPEGYAFRSESSADGKKWATLMTGKVTKSAPRGAPTPAAKPTAPAEKKDPQ